VSEVFLDKKLGIAHEIVAHGDRVPMRIVLRCLADVPAQFGPMNIGDGPVTCMACIGWTEPTFDIKCQYCGVKTGETVYEWATEDVCQKCMDS